MRDDGAAKCETGALDSGRKATRQRVVIAEVFSRRQFPNGGIFFVIFFLRKLIMLLKVIFFL